MIEKITQLTDVVSSKTLQRIQDNFAEAFGISLIIRDTKGKEITKLSKVNTFWKKFIEDNPLTYPHHKKNLIQGIEKAVKINESYIYECYCNTTMFVVPISIHAKVVALFIGGRVRTGNPDLRMCHDEATKLAADFDQFLEAYLELPLLDEHDLKSITNLLKTTATTISTLSFADTQSKEKLEEVSYMNKLLEEEIETRNIALQKSEKKYKNIVENALDIICIIDKDGIITSINEIGTKFIQLPKEEIIGTHFSRYIDPKDINKIKEAFNEVKNGKKDEIDRLKYKGLYSKRTLSINGKAIRGTNGELIALECIIRDVTREEDLLNKLVEADKKYEELFNSVPDGIYACDLEGKLTTINKAGCEILGYTEEELIGKQMKSLYVNPCDRDEFLEEVLNKGYYHGFVAHVRYKNGKKFYIETYSNLIKDKNGNPIAIEGVFRDVTARTKLSNKLSESEKKYKAIFENAFDAIIIMDQNGEILERNKKAQRILGENTKNIQEVLGENALILLKSTEKKDFFNIPVLSFNNNHVSAGISKIVLNDRIIFQVIFHDIKTLIHEKKTVSGQRILEKVY